MTSTQRLVFSADTRLLSVHAAESSPHGIGLFSFGRDVQFHHFAEADRRDL